MAQNAHMAGQAVPPETDETASPPKKRSEGGSQGRALCNFGPVIVWEQVGRPGPNYDIILPDGH